VGSFTAAFFQTYLPLTVYYTINSSTTIFAFLLNYFLFGIQVTAQQTKAVLIAIIGIVLVINGRAIYQLLDSSYEFKSNFEYNSSSLGVQILMGLLVVVWSLIWAYGIVITGTHHATFHAFIYINSALGYFMSSVL
jgi:drug/metabolite transporter (DMT)-like permease